MTLPDTMAAAVVDAEEQQADGLRLHGFWLTCARTLGVLMLFLVLVFYIVTLPAQYMQNITSETLHADLTTNGFFFDFLLVSNLALSTLLVASYTGIAGIIFWRKSNEWIAMLSAFTFLLIVLDVLTPPPEVLSSNAWLTGFSPSSASSDGHLFWHFCSSFPMEGSCPVGRALCSLAGSHYRSRGTSFQPRHSVLRHGLLHSPCSLNWGHGQRVSVFRSTAIDASRTRYSASKRNGSYLAWQHGS